ncbi:hypothetical protein ACOSQ2_021630 [Xanthoceras sorbifolium]
MELFPIQTTQIGLAVTNCYSMQFLHHIQDQWCLLLHQPRHFLKHGTDSPNFMQMARDQGSYALERTIHPSFKSISDEIALINSHLGNDDLIIHVLNSQGSLLSEKEILPSHLRNSMTNFWTLNSFLNIYEEAHADFPITANFT